MNCVICGNDNFHNIFQFTEPPAIETRYLALKEVIYYRETWQCNNCFHFIAVQEMDLSAIYSEDYVSATYKDKAGVRANFNKIISLPIAKSDNNGRVSRINEFSTKYWGSFENKTLLDIGPDQRAAEHIEDSVQVKTICGDFFEVDSALKYDLVTFNKVLEHVKDPIAMLSKSKENLAKNGLVYLEVPDGEIAALYGKEREEFTIDHLYIFSFISLSIMAEKAGFYPVLLERLKEPSTKYTLRAFLKKK